MQALAGGDRPSPQATGAHTRVAPSNFTKVERTFHKIDQRGAKEDGIDVAKVAQYLIKTGTCPTKAHELILKLDANEDGKISLDEWRRGWESNLVGDTSPA